MTTILIVDDEYALVETLTDLLQDEGFRVVTAANGKDGLERVQAERPDLVLTDLMMPIADGRELIRGIQADANVASTPIILMSSSPKSVALLDGGTTPLKVANFLRKPFPWKTLKEAIEAIVGKGKRP
ncbi:MAG TPA: response regulator [Polyangiaceae bacterium]